MCKPPWPKSSLPGLRHPRRPRHGRPVSQMSRKSQGHRTGNQPFLSVITERPGRRPTRCPKFSRMQESRHLPPVRPVCLSWMQEVIRRTAPRLKRTPTRPMPPFLMASRLTAIRAPGPAALCRWTTGAGYRPGSATAAPASFGTASRVNGNRQEGSHEPQGPPHSWTSSVTAANPCPSEKAIPTHSRPDRQREVHVTLFPYPLQVVVVGALVL